jgi:hypothetical protein
MELGRIRSNFPIYFIAKVDKDPITNKSRFCIHYTVWENKEEYVPVDKIIVRFIKAIYDEWGNAKILIKTNPKPKKEFYGYLTLKFGTSLTKDFLRKIVNIHIRNKHEISIAEEDFEGIKLEVFDIIDTKTRLTIIQTEFGYSWKLKKNRGDLKFNNHTNYFKYLYNEFSKKLNGQKRTIKNK